MSAAKSNFRADAKIGGFRYRLSTHPEIWPEVANKRGIKMLFFLNRYTLVQLWYGQIKVRRVDIPCHWLNSFNNDNISVETRA